MKEVEMIVTRSFDLKRKTTHCMHWRVEVDEEKKIVTCQDCNHVIDPFQFVLTMAFDEESIEYRVTELKRKLKSLSDEYDQLSKTVSYMKRKNKFLNQLK